MSIHTHTEHYLHIKISWPSKLANDHQIQYSITVLCKPDKCWSETVIRSDIHNNVSYCRLTSYNTPTYHNRDPKYCLSSQENPVWKNPWQVLIFCTSGGLPNPHRGVHVWYYWHLSFCHLVWYIFTSISEKNVVFFDHDSMFLQNVGKCTPHRQSSSSFTMRISNLTIKQNYSQFKAHKKDINKDIKISK